MCSVKSRSSAAGASTANAASFWKAKLLIPPDRLDIVRFVSRWGNNASLTRPYCILQGYEEETKPWSQGHVLTRTFSFVSVCLVYFTVLILKYLLIVVFYIKVEYTIFVFYTMLYTIFYTLVSYTSH